MAPEQARGEAIDHRADLFSLGAVMYALCTGKSPFAAATTMAVLKRVCDDEPAAIAALNPAVPGWLEALIMTLLAKSPDARPAGAQQVADLLAIRPSTVLKVEAETDSQVKPAYAIPVPERRSRWANRATWIGAAVVSAVIAVGVYFVANRDDKKEHRVDKPADDKKGPLEVVPTITLKGNIDPKADVTPGNTTINVNVPGFGDMFKMVPGFNPAEMSKMPGFELLNPETNPLFKKDALPKQPDAPRKDRP